MDHAKGFEEREFSSVQAPNPRKRKHEGSAAGDPIFKRHPRPSSPTWISTTHNAPSFYDLLSQIELTRRALQEFDRREHLTPKPAPPPAAVQAEGLLESCPLRRAEVSADLKRFARTGGTDLSDIRGFPRPSSILVTKTRNSSQAVAEMSDMPPPKSKGKTAEQRVEPSEESKKSGKTSAYDRNFMTILADRNIEPPEYSRMPANYDEIVTLLEQPRASLSPSDSDRDLAQFRAAVKTARTETMVMSYVFPLIRGSINYPSTMDQLCTNWAPLVADAELVTPKPDYYDGISVGPENKLLRQYLNKIVVPAADAPFLPNFFTEAKGPRGSMDIAIAQAVYDGAFGARAMHYTRNAGSSTDFDSKSYTFSATYANGVLELYAHFLTRADGPATSICYHMSPLGSWSIKHSVKTFREGVTAFRNLRDLAHKMRTELADIATRNLRALALSGKLPAAPITDLDSVAERDDSQISSNMLPSVIDSDSQELAPPKSKRQRKPKQTKPELDVHAKISKASFKAKAKTKPRPRRKNA